MGQAGQDVDWSVTAREGSRGAQLRRALEPTLRERLETVEGPKDVARGFQELRARGEFESAAERGGARQTTSRAHEPSVPYDADKRK